MESRNRNGHRTHRRWSLLLKFAIPIVMVGGVALVGLNAVNAAPMPSPLVAQATPPEPPPPTCIKCPDGYHCAHNPERCVPDKKSSDALHGKAVPPRSFAAL